MDLDSGLLLGREDGTVERRKAAGFYFLSRAEGHTRRDGRRMGGEGSSQGDKSRKPEGVQEKRDRFGR